MKYRVSPLPNTQKSLNFHVQSQDGKNESVYHISREIVSIWGNPSEGCLREYMVAHVKKNGWSKDPVMVCPKSASRSINKAIAELAGKTKKK